MAVKNSPAPIRLAVTVGINRGRAAPGFRITNRLRQSCKYGNWQLVLANVKP